MAFLKPLLFIVQNLYVTFAGILGIGIIIALHEFGHFLLCKLFNIHTPSFSIGFGPKITSKKIGNTEFILSAIPLGGYVEIAHSIEIDETENEEEKTKPYDEQATFTYKPYYQKVLVMLGGILFNMLFAYIVFILLLASGMPKTEILYPINAVPTISAIKEGSAAEKFGLKVGDKILAINNQDTQKSAQFLMKSLQPLANQKAQLLIERNSTQQEVDIAVDSVSIMGKTIGSLGVTYQIIELPSYSFLAAIRQGIALTNLYIINTLYSLKYIFVQRDVSALGGPIMIISETIKGASKGLKIFLLFLAIISINLAILNLIPLPILDGGQILFFSIEALIRRPIPIRIREYIHLATWAAFMLLIVYLSAKDIMRMAGSYIKNILKIFGL